jgi:L-amino acid N-acyltransferase YncA
VSSPAPDVGDLALSVREIRETDTAALTAMHSRLSDRSVYLRFFRALPRLPLEQAERFTHVDGQMRYALVAEDGQGRLVAVARYDRLTTDPAQAEVAVVVSDDLQHRGVGTMLLKRLTAHAREQGVREFVADVLLGNQPMLHAFTDAGLHARTCVYDGNVAHLVLPLAVAPQLRIHHASGRPGRPRTAPVQEEKT